MSYWWCGSILVSYTRGDWVAGLSPFTVMTNILALNSANSVKTFGENSIALARVTTIVLLAQWNFHYLIFSTLVSSQCVKKLRPLLSPDLSLTFQVAFIDCSFDTVVTLVLTHSSIPCKKKYLTSTTSKGELFALSYLFVHIYHRNWLEMLEK